MGMTPTLTTVASSATSVTILAENASRKAAVIQNTSTAILYLRLGTAAATDTTGHSIQLASGARYELPMVENNGNTETYRGAITGIWASADGQANVTEFT